MHIPDDPLYFEKFYFTPGDLGFRVEDEIREDQRVDLLGPMVSRSGTADGDAGRGDFILSDGHRLASERKGRIRRQPARRVGNHSAQPRCGQRLLRRGAEPRIGLEKPIGGDGGIEFWGQSFVAGTSGQILAKASVNKEEILIVPIDLSKVDVTRTHWPFLRDRRIEHEAA